MLTEHVAFVLIYRGGRHVWMDGYGVCCLALEAYFDLYPRRKRGEQ
jgi:hypothetical protein